MANTVNDVMNVIASPDYGIKNIAGTNQEILAILQGTHNSQNNIHNIVDDVRNLLQKLVDVSSEKKSIEIESTSTKINHKHIESILDETRSIRKAIDKLAIKLGKEMSSTPAIAKLSDKASEKVAEAMVKNIEKEKTGGGLTSVVDAFNKLKNISLKDILIGKRKVKLITKVFKNAQEELDIKEKDLDAVIKLINAAPQMIKSLSKVSWRIDRIIKKEVIRKLSEILVGKNSILTISKDIQKNEKTFLKANKISKDIVELSSSLNSVMWSLIFTSLWSKLASKGIKDIDSALTKIINFSKKLTKNKSEIKKGAKAAKDLKDLASSLNKAMRKLIFAALWAKLASVGIKSLDNTITKIFPLARKLTKNRDIIKKGAKAARRMTVLAGNLLITSIFLAIAAVTAGPAILGAILLSKMVGRIIPVAKKLSRNSKHFRKAIIPSIMLLTLSGIMALTSIVLATIAKTGVPALLGSILMLGIVAVNIISFKLLGESLKAIAKGAISMLIMSLSLMLFSVTLSKITNATKGVTFKQVAVIALLTLVLAGAVAVVGMLLTQVILGSIAMAIMSFALRPFATTIGMIVENTKNVTMKQVLAVAGLTLLLAGTVALTGALLVPIILGSIAIAIMGFALRPFATTIGMVVENTKNVTMKQALAVGGLIMALGGAVAGLAILLIPIGLGALAVGILSSTLKPFATTLGMITKATEKLTMKQVKLVSSAMWSLGKGVSKMALLLIPIKLAKGAVKTLSSVLKPFVVTLAMVSKATEKLTMKQVKLVSSAMWTLGKGVSKMARLLIPVKLGAKTVKALGYALLPFVRVLNILSKIGEVPTKSVNDVIKSLRTIGNFFKYNKLRSKVIKNANRYLAIMPPFTSCVYSISKLSKIGSDIPMNLVYGTLQAMKAIADYYINNPIERKVIKQARRYKRMMRPFGYMIGHLSKLKKFGSVPMKLVYGTLQAMKAIADYYINNPIERKVIKQARRYKRMMRPFGYMIGHLSKLKKFGSVPMKLVYGTLQAMKAIADYYINNPIERKVIKQARRYKRMMRPFGYMIGHLSKLKKFGSVPMKLVYGTLQAMKAIADYYINNPIERKVIKQSRRYKRLLRPFGYAVEHLSKLKKMGHIPMKLVYQALNAISAVASFYKNQKMGFFEGVGIRASASMITGIVSSFGKAVESFKTLKDMYTIPTKAIDGILSSIWNIVWFYRFITFGDDLDTKTELTKTTVEKFTTMAKEIQDKFNGMKVIDHKAVASIVRACHDIIDFYTYTKFSIRRRKIKNMNYAVKQFVKAAEILKKVSSLEFTKKDSLNINRITESMKRIIRFYTGANLLKLLLLNKTSSNINDAIKRFADASNYLKENIQGFEEKNIDNIGIIAKMMKRIIRFYTGANLLKLLLLNKTSSNINDAIKRFADTSNYLKESLQEFTINDYISVKLLTKSMKRIIRFYAGNNLLKIVILSKTVPNINRVIKCFANISKYLKENTEEFTSANYKSVKLITKSMRYILNFLKKDSLNFIQRRKAEKNMSLISRMALAMSRIAKFDSSNISSIGSSLSDALNGVNSVDLGQVEAVTNMFNAFNGINKSESIINKFTESVKEFTETCKNLMDAMSQNTDAINNMDANGSVETQTSEMGTTTVIENGSTNVAGQSGGIRIANVEEIAKTIAEKINGALSIDMPDTQVQLLINGSGGNEWTITRY